MVEFVWELQEWIDSVSPIVLEHLLTDQKEQRWAYNQPVQLRVQTGRTHPSASPCKLLVHWQGHYTILECVGLVNYWLKQPGKLSMPLLSLFQNG